MHWTMSYNGPLLLARSSISPIAHKSDNPLPTVRQWCSGVWGFSVTLSARTPMRTIHMPSMLASTTRRRGGDDLVVVLVKHHRERPQTTESGARFGPAQS